MRPERLRAGVFTATGLMLSASAHVVGQGHLPEAAPLAAVALRLTGRRGPAATAVLASAALGLRYTF